MPTDAPSNPFPNNVHILHRVTLKLDDTNYLLWKTQFESLLSSQKLLGFVNGSTAAPPSVLTVVTDGVSSTCPNPQYRPWFYTDQLVRSWLFGTLSVEALVHVHNLTTSRDVWVSLAENFNQSSLPCDVALRRNLQMITKNGRSFAVYCREFKAICDALSSIGKPIGQKMKIFSFLNGLGREYDPVTTVIQSSLTKPPTPSFNDVVTIFQGFDSKLQSYEETSVNPHMAFQMQRTNYSDNYRIGSANLTGNQRGRGRFGPNRDCGGYSSRGRCLSQHQSSSLTSGDRRTCQICGRIGLIALKCYNRFDNNYQTSEATQVFSSLRISDENGKEWYPNSGAYAHVTASTSGLQTTSPYEEGGVKGSQT